MSITKRRLVICGRYHICNHMCSPIYIVNGSTFSLVVPQSLHFYCFISDAFEDRVQVQERSPEDSLPTF